MNNVFYRFFAGLFLTIFLAAGSAVPISGLPGDGFRVSQANSDIRDLSRQFQSETPAVLLFEIGSDVLSAEAQKRLDIQADWIQLHPTVRVRVYGYAERAGNPAYNMALSLRRAHAVVSYLARKGVAPNRLEAMVSFGEEFPVDAAANLETIGQQTTTRIIGVSARPVTADALSTTNAVPNGTEPEDRRAT